MLTGRTGCAAQKGGVQQAPWMRTNGSTLGIMCRGVGVMKPSELKARGTSGGTCPMPSSAPVHSTVPSPPSVTTRSSLSATFGQLQAVRFSASLAAAAVPLQCPAGAAAAEFDQSKHKDQAVVSSHTEQVQAVLQGQLLRKLC